jgi:sulfatase modifying factor 1
MYSRLRERETHTRQLTLSIQMLLPSVSRSRMSRLLWVLMILRVGTEWTMSQEITDTIKPLPKNLSADQYGSRESFLQQAATYETERLQSRPWRYDGEEAFFAGDGIASVDLGDGLELRFRRIDGGQYIDGITSELKDRILGVPNRSGDLRRWEAMFDTERRDTVSVGYIFFMSETIISNALFAAFVRETGYRTTVERYATGWIVDSQAQWMQGFANSWDLQVYPMSEPDHPVVQVSWFDAMNFAAWLNEKTGVFFRLPTKEEWLLAARPESYSDRICLFPWGNQFDGLGKRMNFGTADLQDYAWIHEQYRDGFARSSPVKAFPATDRGLHDMLGNVWVWNWTNNAQYESRSNGPRSASPLPLEQLGTESNQAMTMTGGCYLARLSHANLLSRMSHPALDGAEDIGFRLVAVFKSEGGLWAGTKKE